MLQCNYSAVSAYPSVADTNFTFPFFPLGIVLALDAAANAIDASVCGVILPHDSTANMPSRMSLCRAVKMNRLVMALAQCRIQNICNSRKCIMSAALSLQNQFLAK